MSTRYTILEIFRRAPKRIEQLSEKFKKIPPLWAWILVGIVCVAIGLTKLQNRAELKIYGGPLELSQGPQEITQPYKTTVKFELAAFDSQKNEIPIKKEFDQLIEKMGPQTWEHRQKNNIFAQRPQKKLQEIQILWRELLKMNPQLSQAQYVHLVRRATKRQVLYSKIILAVDVHTWKITDYHSRFDFLKEK